MVWPSSFVVNPRLNDKFSKGHFLCMSSRGLVGEVVVIILRNLLKVCLIQYCIRRCVRMDHSHLRNTKKRPTCWSVPREDVQYLTWSTKQMCHVLSPLSSNKGSYMDHPHFPMQQVSRAFFVLFVATRKPLCSSCCFGSRPTSEANRKKIECSMYIAEKLQWFV